VDKTVAAKMKALAGKKRKSGNEANFINEPDGDLAGFNYDDMDNLILARPRAARVTDWR
jgi:hypothetical protein